jgi:hypothetical protein
MSSRWSRLLERYVVASPTDPGGSRKRKYATLLLLAGGVAAAMMVVPQLPREREIELRLEDAASVTGVDVAWSPATGSSPSKADAVRGASWHFALGKAPTSLTTRVSLPDGRYDLDVLVERGAERETLHRVLSIGESDHITVRLR